MSSTSSPTIMYRKFRNSKRSRIFPTVVFVLYILPCQLWKLSKRYSDQILRLEWDLELERSWSLHNPYLELFPRFIWLESFVRGWNVNDWQLDGHLLPKRLEIGEDTHVVIRDLSQAVQPYKVFFLIIISIGKDWMVWRKQNSDILDDVQALEMWHAIAIDIKVTHLKTGVRTY